MITGLKLENGQYGRRGVVTSAWSDRMTTYVKDHEISELELNHAKGWHGNDLMFLFELPHLVSFQILDLRISDVTPIHSLHALKTLRDITPFASLTELKSLAILNAPIESLRGLERLQKLRRLRLANLRRISSLAGIETLNRLEELEIHTCRGFSSIEELRPLTNLRTLSLSNNGSIDSFGPLEGLARLESLVFYESTNVLDGDLSPVWSLRTLSNVSFQNRPHYSHRREDFRRPRGQ
jgi:hypothetical protein